MPGQIYPIDASGISDSKAPLETSGCVATLATVGKTELSKSSSFGFSKTSWSFILEIWLSVHHGALVLGDLHLLSAWFLQAGKSILCLRELKTQRCLSCPESPCQGSADISATRGPLSTTRVHHLTSQKSMLLKVDKMLVLGFQKKVIPSLSFFSLKKILNPYHEPNHTGGKVGIKSQLLTSRRAPLGHFLKTKNFVLLFRAAPEAYGGSQARG